MSVEGMDKLACLPSFEAAAAVFCFAYGALLILAAHPTAKNVYRFLEPFLLLFGFSAEKCARCCHSLATELCFEAYGEQLQHTC